MSEGKSRIENRDGFATKLSNWLNDVKEHEMTDLVEFIETVKAYAFAAEALPEERVKQFVDNFRYDLKEFYHMWQQDDKDTIYEGLLNEVWWDSLAKMTDKSQVEWAELTDDFEHNGEYFTGDYIGFGEIECCECHEKLTLLHFSEVPVCANCGKGKFFRHGLAP